METIFVGLILIVPTKMRPSLEARVTSMGVFTLGFLGVQLSFDDLTFTVL